MEQIYYIVAILIMAIVFISILLISSKRDGKLISEIEEIFNDKSISSEEKINAVKEKCRNTRGKVSAGIYFTLDSYQESIDEMFKELMDGIKSRSKPTKKTDRFDGSRD